MTSSLKKESNEKGIISEPADIYQITKDTALALEQAKEKGKECRLQRVQKWCTDHVKECIDVLEHGHLIIKLKFHEFAEELNIQCTEEWNCFRDYFKDDLHIGLGLYDANRRVLVSAQMMQNTPEWVELSFT